MEKLTKILAYVLSANKDESLKQTGIMFVLTV